MLAEKLSPEFDNRFASLRDSYRKSLLQKIKDLQATEREILTNAQGGDVQSPLENARALSHKLAGSAQTFGYPTIGQLSRQLESILDQVLNGGTQLHPDLQAQITALIKDLVCEADAVTVESRDEGAKIIPLSDASAETTLSPSNARPHRAILALSGTSLARDILYCLEKNGFNVKVEDSPDSAMASARENQPDIALIFLEPGNPSGFYLAEQFWKEESLSGLEVFFLLASVDFPQEATQHGITDEWFFSPPLDAQDISIRMLRRTFDIKVGRQKCNRIFLGPHLPTLMQLSTAQAKHLGQDEPPTVKTHLFRNNTNKKVLVVDDDRHLAEAMVDALRDQGLQVFKAHSGVQGLTRFKEISPDLIITDFDMPNGSGEYLLNNLKILDPDGRTKIILATGERVVRKFRLDDEAYTKFNVIKRMTKPLDLGQLCSEVLEQIHA